MYKTIFLLSLLVLCKKTYAENNPISKADQYRTFDVSYQFVSQVTEDKSSEVSKFNIFIDGESTLAVQTEPVKSQDRKLLMKGDELWLITPGSKRPVRISFEQRLAGEISNGDILRTNFAKDYTYKNLGKEKIGKVNTEVFELVRKTPAATYAKIKYYLKSPGYQPVKAIFYAPSGKELKSADYLTFKKIGKRNICVAVEIKDLTTLKKSILTYANFKFTKFPASFFNKDALAN